MDNYDPIKMIGKGSFGAVYLCARRSDRHEFVMKKMLISGVAQKELDAYANEVALLTKLQHPGIVEHIESFTDKPKENMCIVMGYCEGGDLSQFLKHKSQQLGKDGKLSEKEVLYHFIQMALSLNYMHEQNILHRDLKTQNIFIKNGLIQLGDFGISKEISGSMIDIVDYTQDLMSKCSRHITNRCTDAQQMQ
jgi:serine/threonine protein kinase